MSQPNHSAHGKKTRRAPAFRIGKVKAYRRGKVWYLCYVENGKRRRPRIGPDRASARTMAAQINGQLETGTQSMLSFEPIAIADLRERWLAHHEHVLRSSLQTIRRYRTATEHLLRFLETTKSVRLASHFRTCHAEDFVRYLRSVRVAPNGHPNAAKRPLLDKGIQYILESCRTLFKFALLRRHLSPYAENPFGALEIGRMPVENVRPIHLPGAAFEDALLQACDVWQFPVFLTLMLTGLRPGELVHLMLPEDVDLDGGWLFVRNRPQLGWQVKTRKERELPLLKEHAAVLRAMIGRRDRGPVFRRRRFGRKVQPPLVLDSQEAMAELKRQVVAEEAASGQLLPRQQRAKLAQRLWVDLGAVRTDRIRSEFMRLTKRLKQPAMTAPKTLRHLFATRLQDANVDPLIRNELMGHTPALGKAGNGLGMTAVYTHTRPETKRKQLEGALADHPALAWARKWVTRLEEKRDLGM